MYFHQKRLVRKGGYEIFLQNIDRVRFQYEHACIHMYWHRKDVENMLSWFVNKKGMISIYALIMLSIVAVFITYLTTLIQTQHLQKDISYVDIYAIHYVKRKIKEQDEVLDTYEEIKHWKQYQLNFYYEKGMVTVTMKSKSIHLRYKFNMMMKRKELSIVHI